MSGAPNCESLLEYLKSARGFDFDAYKRPGLVRRIEKRMLAVGADSFEAYHGYLKHNESEFLHLFDSILINVTSFFRDEPAWELLTRQVLPRLDAEKPADEPIRIWSAGCATGQEAYSILMAMADLIGIDRVRQRVKLYATDADEGALSEARQGSYAARDMAGVPARMLDRYFDVDGDRCTVHRDLRRAVIFGRHNLISDAPISRIDLLACRNTLMYFNGDVQERIVSRFRFAINDGGYLFLGKAESLHTHADKFVPLDLRRRIFLKP